ncbi:MAG: LLM class F420-dependent oxidoreductase [Chloroflexi bacterium]|nr:LLM class F420-dependent oxidoreductase [Chloroflexota bacterium]
MEFGIHLENRGTRASPEWLLSHTDKAEECGFDAVWLADHVITPVEIRSPYPFAAQRAFVAEESKSYFEPLATLGFLAGRTRRIRLGIGVLIVPYRNPVFVGKFLAVIDVLTGGRLILGIGLGWMAEEFAALQATPFAERGAATDEYLQIFKALWTEETSSFHGKYYSFDNLWCFPKPIQKPHPPLWVGGHSRWAMRRAVRMGDGWLPSRLPRVELAEKLAELRQVVQEEGRRYEELVICARADLHLTDVSGVRPIWSSSHLDLGLIGTTAEVIGELQHYRELGVHHLYFNLAPNATLEERLLLMEHFAEKVMPHFSL